MAKDISKVARAKVVATNKANDAARAGSSSGSTRMVNTPSTGGSSVTPVSNPNSQTTNQNTGFVAGSLADRQAQAGKIKARSGYGTTAAPEAPYNPYGDYQGEVDAQVNAPYAETAKLGKELGLKFETSAESYMKDKLKQQKEELAYQERMRARQDKLEASDIARQGEITTANIAGAEQAYGPNREGMVSTGNAKVVDQFGKEANRQFSSLQERGAMAQEERARIIDKLKQAQKDDNFAMVDNYRAQLAAADNKILQNAETTAAIQASQASTEQTKQETTFAQLENMGSLVGDLSPTQLQAMGNNAGLSLPQMVNLQKGYQLRALALEQKNQADADHLEAQAQELIQSVQFEKEDRSLDVRFKEAETRIKEAEANGVILDPMKRLEYSNALAEQADYTGEGEVYLPGGTKYAVTPTGTGISIGAQDTAPGGQCGRFVNDVIGMPSYIKDRYADKTALINSQVPQPGMIGVMATAGSSAANGHVFMVEKVNPDGTMDVVESNYSGDERISRRQGVPIGTAAGFIKPPTSKAITTTGTGGLDSSTIIQVNQKANGTGDQNYTQQQKEALNTINAAFENPNSDLLTVMSFSAGGSAPIGGQIEQIGKYDTVLTALSQLESSIQDSNPGGVVKAIKNITLSPIPFQTKRKKIEAQITMLVPELARGVFGEVGVLTDTDVARYTKLLPTLDTTEKIQNSLLDLVRTAVYNKAESQFNTLARSKVDVSRFTGSLKQLRESRERLQSGMVNGDDDDESIYQKSAPTYDNSASSTWDSL